MSDSKCVFTSLLLGCGPQETLSELVAALITLAKSHMSTYSHKNSQDRHLSTGRKSISLFDRIEWFHRYRGPVKEFNMLSQVQRETAGKSLLRVYWLR